jgi:AcrR family transcriptional regulator
MRDLNSNSVTGRPQGTSRSTRDAAGSLSKLLDGAQQSFSEHGYHAATVHDICARANVGIGTFYAHFDDKSQLLKRLMSERAVTLSRLLHAADFVDAATLSQKLRHIVDEPVAAGMWRAWHEAVLVEPSLGGFHTEWQNTTLAALTEHILEARRTGKTQDHLVDPQAAAWAVMSLSREFAIHDREYRPDREALAQLLMALVLGVSAGSRP